MSHDSTSIEHFTDDELIAELCQRANGDFVFIKAPCDPNDELAYIIRWNCAVHTARGLVSYALSRLRSRMGS